MSVSLAKAISFKNIQEFMMEKSDGVAVFYFFETVQEFGMPNAGKKFFFLVRIYQRSR